MAQNYQIKPKKKVLKQISLAVCLLFLGHQIIKELGSIWGFAALAEQIAGTFVAFAVPIEAVFLGKYLNEKDKED